MQANVVFARISIGRDLSRCVCWKYFVFESFVMNHASDAGSVSIQLNRVCFGHDGSLRGWAFEYYLCMLRLKQTSLYLRESD